MEDFEFNFELDQEEKTEEFAPYYVAVTSEQKRSHLLVWAESIENAMTCGEILSSIYL